MYSRPIVLTLSDLDNYTITNQQFIYLNHEPHIHRTEGIWKQIHVIAVCNIPTDKRHQMYKLIYISLMKHCKYSTYSNNSLQFNKCSPVTFF